MAFQPSVAVDAFPFGALLVTQSLADPLRDVALELAIPALSSFPLLSSCVKNYLC